jgi:hypothetical protein
MKMRSRLSFQLPKFIYSSSSLVLIAETMRKTYYLGELVIPPAFARANVRTAVQGNRALTMCRNFNDHRGVLISGMRREVYFGSFRL